jgi:PQQ-dependent dehydrogenase (s-GDH family)
MGAGDSGSKGNSAGTGRAADASSGGASSTDAGTGVPADAGQDDPAGSAGAGGVANDPGGGGGGDIASTAGEGGAGEGGAGGEPRFALRVLMSGLAGPWEITGGPDDLLWITERVGRRILRVRPGDGALLSEFPIPEATQSSGQDGLLGLALHPSLSSDANSRFVYVAYTYDADPGDGVDRRAKLRRFTFDPATQTLGQPLDLITDLPASDDHNSGRLVFGPDARLYYTIGDQGSNQFSTVCNPNRAQQLPSAEQIAARDYASYAGKILRLELDGSMPADNPVLAGVRSHVFSYGHRNAQGIVFAGGRLYADEHGPKSDDELNLITAGKNYGWPNVSGYRDGQAYVYADWSASTPTPCQELEYSDYVIPQSVPVALETVFLAPDFVPPLATFYTVPDGYDFHDPACPINDYICWPTIAPSSLDYYPAGGAIPAWGNSLLLSSLKQGALFRVQLAADGQSVVGVPEAVLKTQNRYRDLAIQPGGGAIYVVTDPEGAMVGPEGGFSTESQQPGAILEFTATAN